MNLLVIGVAAILLAARVDDLVLLLEREQLLADSIAWRYAKEIASGTPATGAARDYELAGAGRIRVEVLVMPDGKTVRATACNTEQICAISMARSLALVQPQ